MSSSKRKKLPPIKTLKNRADRLWRDIIMHRASSGFYSSLDQEGLVLCAVCRKDEATQVHHIFHKKMHGGARWDLRNGIPICKGCHHIERFRPAFTVVAAIRHIGFSEFWDLAEAVEAAEKNKGLGKKDVLNVITGLEELHGKR